MNAKQFVVEYPEYESYGEVMKGYFSLMRGFGLEFESRCNRILGEEIGPGWFDGYRRIRKDQGKVKGRVDLSDPSFFLKDYLFSADTIFKKVLSSELSVRIAAKKIIDVRNTWLHFSDEPSTADLEEAATYIREFAEKNKMSVAGPAAQLIKRIGKIRSGQYPAIAQPELSPAEPTTGAGDAGEPPTAVELDAPLPGARPPIGGTWIGRIPTRQLRVTRTGDIVDTNTGDSITTEVVGPPAEKARQWLSARPNGSLWVDTDGAVGGFVHGVPRLLGYTGLDPEGEIARGFLLPKFYDVRDERVVELETGIALTDAVADQSARDAATVTEAALVSAVAPGGTIRVTTFGDVLYLDEDGMQRLATVTPASWFPGHFEV